MATKNNGKAQASPAPAAEAAKVRPVKEVRLGRIRATVWENQAEGGPWYKVVLTRSYKEGEEWKSTASFGRDDLLLVAKVADLAHTWIHRQLQGEGQEQAPVGGETPF